MQVPKVGLFCEHVERLADRRPVTAVIRRLVVVLGIRQKIAR